VGLWKGAEICEKRGNSLSLDPVGLWEPPVAANFATEIAICPIALLGLARFPGLHAPRVDRIDAGGTRCQRQQGTAAA